MLVIFEPYPDVNKMRLWRLISDALKEEGLKVSFLLAKKQYIDFVPEFKGWICYEKYVTAVLPISQLRDVNFFEDYSEAAVRLEELKSGTVIMVWNGQSSAYDVLKPFAGKFEFRFWELAWFPQSQYIYCDKQGVNGAASIVRSEPVPIAFREVALNPKRILLPLQLEQDTNIKDHSPFSTMSEFVSHLVNTIPADSSVEAIVIRSHPREPQLRDSLDFDDARICWDEDTLEESLRKADLIVGINSTLLLEALVFKKPVVAFGKNVYSGHSVVIEANMADDWASLMTRSASDAESFLSMLRSRQISLSDLLKKRKIDLRKKCELETVTVGDAKDSIWKGVRPSLIGLFLKPLLWHRWNLLKVNIF